MRNVLKHPKSLLLAGLFIIVITAVAWQTDDKEKKDSTANKQSKGDTIVPKQHYHDTNEFRIKDLDKAMKDLNDGMKELNLNMQDLSIDISKNIKDALAEIDFDKMHKEIDLELKQVDFEKIGKEVQEELKKIDFNKINIDVQSSLKDAQEELKKIDIQKLQNEMKELQLKLNNSEFKTQIESAMKDARKEIEKARQELQDLKDFTDALQKDGLVDKKKGYTLEWTKDGDLIINGKTQPKEIADKYSHYYKKEGYKIKIRPEGAEGYEVDDL